MRTVLKKIYSFKNVNMLKSGLFLIAIVATQLLTAQKPMVIKVHADYLVYDNNNVHHYKKQESGALTGSIAEINYSLKPHAVTFREFETTTLAALKTKLKPYQKLIKITDLDTYTVAQLTDVIKDKTLFYKVQDDLYRIYNYHAGLITTDGIETKSKTLNMFTTGVFNTAVLQFDTGQTMLLFAGNSLRNAYFNSFLMPINDSFTFNNNTLHDGEYFGYSKAQIKKQDSTSVARLAHYANYSFKDKTIKDLAFDLPLIETDYDTIQFAGDVIVARKKEQLTIYNKQLKDITPAGLRAYALFDYDKLEVIVGNEKRFLISDGTLAFTAQKRPVLVCGSVDSWTSTIVKKDGFYQLEYVLDGTMTGAGITKSTHKLFLTASYDRVMFFNGETTLYEDANSGYVDSSQLPILIAHNKKGYHFFNYKWNRSSVNYKMVSTIEVDTNSTAVYDQLFLNEQSAFMRVEKNGLLGFYPMHLKPKFRKLEPMQTNFTRFTLPTGKQGWLQQDATEIIDL